MLVITRKLGQEIVISSNIVVEVLTIDCGRVRLGVTAPSDVQIWRRELFDQRQQQQPRTGNGEITRQ
jgi:carbon storage regulator